MELCGIPPPTIDWSSSNLPESWKKFEQHVNLIFTGPLKEKAEEEKVSYLLLWVGDKGRYIYNTFPAFSAEEKKKLKPHLDKFQSHVKPKLNPIFAIYKFKNEVQGSRTFDQFVTKLKLLARDCNFKDTDDMIRDRIVFGIQLEKIREKLIIVGEDLTLDKAIQLAQAYEYSQEQLKLMGQSSTHVQVKTDYTPVCRQERKETSHSAKDESQHAEVLRIQSEESVNRDKVQAVLQVREATLVSRFLSSARQAM